MRALRPVALTLAGLVLAGCQSRDPTADAQPTGDRLQGRLEQRDSRWYLLPCGRPGRLALTEVADVPLAEQARRLAQTGPVHADLRGTLSGTLEAGSITPTHLYRLEASPSMCDDAAFSQLHVRAGGQQPAWLATLSSKGLLLEREQQPPVALPYVEERLPDGSLGITSEANARRVELWIRPVSCRTAFLYTPLTAVLDVDGERLQGCAYLGGARPN